MACFAALTEAYRTWKRIGEEAYWTRKRIDEDSGLFVWCTISYEPVELTSRVSTAKVSEAKRKAGAAARA